MYWKYFALLLLLFGREATPTLEVEIHGLKSTEGKVMIAVFDNSEDFLSDNVVASGIFDIRQESSERFSMRLPFGEYAISVFHDENGDGELNTNAFGIPKEAYGFSNNARGMFGPPDFEESRFEFKEDKQRISIKVK